MPDRFPLHASVPSFLSRGVIARAAVATAIAAAAACMPAPSPNEVNFSDEGTSQGVAAASRIPPGELDRIGIGKSINGDNTIADASRTFARQDTVYASARVQGMANSGIVRVVWFDTKGQPVAEQTRIVTPSSGEIVALQAKRDIGWTPGEHTVEFFLDDRLMGTERYTVTGEAQAGAAQHGGANPSH
jgi:hypothetical protein